MCFPLLSVPSTASLELLGKEPELKPSLRNNGLWGQAQKNSKDSSVFIIPSKMSFP